MLEHLDIKSAPARVSVNFAELKKRLEKHVQQYDVVVTNDSVGDAKKLATDLNKQAKELDQRRKDEVAKVSEPIRHFDEQMKELVGLYKDGRKRILDQVERFEDDTRRLAGQLLDDLREKLWVQHAVSDEFKSAEFDDLIKLTSVTSKGNLSKAAKDELERRVLADRAKQDRTALRLSELKNRSYEAGLHAPLTRDHVTPFLFAEPEVYDRELQRILDVEVERQNKAEQRMREQQEREARQKVEAEQREAERRQRLQDATDPIDRNVKQPETAAGETDDQGAPWDSAAAERHSEPAAPAKPATPGKAKWRVVCTFEIEVGPAVQAEAICDEARKVLKSAGVTTLQSVEAVRKEDAAA